MHSFVGQSSIRELCPPALLLLEGERTEGRRKREVLHLFRCYTHTHICVCIIYNNYKYIYIYILVVYGHRRNMKFNEETKARSSCSLLACFLLVFCSSLVVLRGQFLTCARCATDGINPGGVWTAKLAPTGAPRQSDREGEPCGKPWAPGVPSPIWEPLEFAHTRPAKPVL